MITIILGKDTKAGPKFLDRNLRVPESGTFFQVFHSWQQEKNDYKPVQYQDGFEQPNKAMPSPMQLWGCRMGPTSDYQQMHESWQWRYYELFRFMVGNIPADGEIDYWYTGGEGRQKFDIVPAGTKNANPRFKPGTLKDAYSHIFEDHRALTDGAAYNSTNFWGRDVVMGCHLENPKTWRMKCLTWDGSLLEKHKNPPGPVPAGYHAVRAWDHTKPAPSLDVLLAPDAPPLVWGTEGQVKPLTDEHGRPILWEGRPSYAASHFPWLKLVCRAYGLPEVGTPFFSIGIDGWNLIKKEDCRQVPNGSYYSPYWPGK